MMFHQYLKEEKKKDKEIAKISCDEFKRSR